MRGGIITKNILGHEYDPNEEVRVETIQYMDQQLDMDRLCTLMRLMDLCEQKKIVIKSVSYFRNGFCVLFDGIEGDAILHDGSSGRNIFLWETIGQPWDHDSVSSHDTETLVELISRYLRGEDWEEVDK